MKLWGGILLAASMAIAAHGAVAQDRESVVLAERRAFATWLQQGATSPYAVLTQRAIGRGVSLGPAAADVPVPGLPLHRVSLRNGTAYLEQGGESRPLPRHRPVSLGQHRLAIAGTGGRTVLTIYAPEPRNPKPPEWYPYDPALALTVSLKPAPSPRSRRLLAADGLEVTAIEAGTVQVTLEGISTELQVYRVPDPTGEESELEIYFRDETSGNGTYPAGRFVSLQPLAGNRYRLDFNRARNPFCAYSTAFACPLPWRGNSLTAPIMAGEKYTGGGLTPPGGETPG